MQILLLVDWYYLQQQRQQLQYVPDQVKNNIRFLKYFSDIVSLQLLGSEFSTLRPVYLINCFP